jgi:hypothetical protein
MNIFAVSSNPKEAAEMLCDKHIVKMPIESAQMLSTTHRFLDGTETVAIAINGRRYKTWTHPSDALGSPLYRSTMINHPCTIWTRETIENYLWHAQHAMELCREYTRRYDRIHGSQKVIEWCVKNIPTNITSGDLTPFAQAMPDEYKDSTNSVNAYRQYYIGAKFTFAKWKSGFVPDWWPRKNFRKNQDNLLTTA